MSCWSPIGFGARDSVELQGGYRCAAQFGCSVAASGKSLFIKRPSSPARNRF